MKIMDTLRYYAARLAACACCMTFLTLLGCSTMPVVQPVPSCITGLDPEVLNEACSTDQVLPDGSTFADVIKDDKSVRQFKAVCAAKVKALQESAKTCNEVIARHNETLKAINK